MYRPSRSLFLAAGVALFFALSFALIAQEPPAKAGDQPPPATDTSVEKQDPPSAKADAADAQPEARKKTRSELAREKARERLARRRANETGEAVVNVFADSSHPAGQTTDAVVAVFGSATSEGDVVSAVVAVFGSTRITGNVGEAAVTIFGNTYVNSHIEGPVVTVLGDVELGPDAEVDGPVVCVMGVVKRDSGANLHQGVQNIFGNAIAHREGLMAWIHQCLLRGRPLAFGPHLGWAWMIALSFLGLYCILALLFREGIEKCVLTLSTRPGSTVLTAFLTVLISPIAIILLVMTGIGVFIVPVVGAGLFFASLFGVAAVLAWFGLKVTRRFGDNHLAHPALAVLLAGLIVLLLYTVPVVGFFTFKLLGWLGMGLVILTLLQAMKRERPAPVAAAAMPAAPAVAMTADTGAAGAAAAAVPEGVATPLTTPPPVVPPPLAPPLISASTLPRAGFWIRIAGLLLDLILLSVIAAILTSGGKVAVFGMAVYAAVLWKLKGTTIGGVICGLKVVRIDNRPIDWGTAIVRALGCFLSLAVFGLGFIWVAIDDDAQSWHDKIAGTTVVRVPKGISLL
jgi:uncharacterized RDD family membrane protein YckC